MIGIYVGLALIVIFFTIIGAIGNVWFFGLLSGITIAAFLAAIRPRYFGAAFRIIAPAIKWIALISIFFTLGPVLLGLFHENANKAVGRLSLNSRGKVVHWIEKQSLKLEVGDIVSVNKDDSYVYGNDFKPVFYKVGGPILLFKGKPVMIVEYEGKRLEKKVTLGQGRVSETMVLVLLPDPLTGDFIGDLLFWFPVRNLDI